MLLPAPPKNSTFWFRLSNYVNISFHPLIALSSGCRSCDGFDWFSFEYTCGIYTHSLHELPFVLLSRFAFFAFDFMVDVSLLILGFANCAACILLPVFKVKWP